jgi:hypothetical protein
MKQLAVCAFLIGLFFGAASTGSGQTPAPIVIQAATPGPVSAPPAPAKDSGTVRAAITALNQLKAANDEVIAKQKATLDRLDELQKAADQLKIFTHRTGG